MAQEEFEEFSSEEASKPPSLKSYRSPQNLRKENPLLSLAFKDF